MRIPTTTSIMIIIIIRTTILTWTTISASIDSTYTSSTPNFSFSSGYACSSCSSWHIGSCIQFIDHDLILCRNRLLYLQETQRTHLPHFQLRSIASVMATTFVPVSFKASIDSSLATISSTWFWPQPSPIQPSRLLGIPCYFAPRIRNRIHHSDLFRKNTLNALLLSNSSIAIVVVTTHSIRLFSHHMPQLVLLLIREIRCGFHVSFHVWLMLWLLLLMQDSIPLLLKMTVHNILVHVFLIVI